MQLLHTDETADAVLLFFRAAAGGDMYRSLKLQPWDEARLRDQVRPARAAVGSWSLAAGGWR